MISKSGPVSWTQNVAVFMCHVLRTADSLCDDVRVARYRQLHRTVSVVVPLSGFGGIELRGKVFDEVLQTEDSIRVNPLVWRRTLAGISYVAGRVGSIRA
jgi:hypothetical protein